MLSFLTGPIESSRVRARAFPLRPSASAPGSGFNRHPPPPNNSFKPTPCRGIGHVLYATLAHVRRPNTGRLNSGVRRGENILAKIVDTNGHWAAAIGKGFVAFGGIEHTTVVCLRTILKDSIPKFTKSLKLGQRIDLLLELLEPYQQRECLDLAEKLRSAKDLTQTRNLIAHNPLVFEIYEDGNGGYTFGESIAAIHRVGHKITLAEVQDFADKSEHLAHDLIGVSISAFKALGIKTRA
jgi:hypothetical protein